jgi:hypothetical protein
MLSCDVLSVVILIDSGVVGIRIFLAGMLAFANSRLILHVCLWVHKGATHVMMAVVAPAGTSAFSMALVNFSCTSVARLYRFHESVSVAYLRVMDRPPFMIVLIVELLITLAILAGVYNVN